MRVPNGGKMDPKSALFLRVTIMRIHSKKQGLGGGDLILKLDKNQVFICFCKKNCFFTTQHFASTGSLFFRFTDHVFHIFVHVFLLFFSGPILELCTQNIGFDLQNTALSGLRVCWLILKHRVFE